MLRRTRDWWSDASIRIPVAQPTRQHPCPGFKQSIQTMLNSESHYRDMKVMALVAGLVIGGSVIDAHYFHGQYLRAAIALTQKVAIWFGLPR
ncbi:MAG: hypothetical protein K2Y71_15325 [Xanthobacteraceae bacterium]|nr:hypothetical protein [Xanthobacteraceae bacterium]